MRKKLAQAKRRQVAKLRYNTYLLSDDQIKTFAGQIHSQKLKNRAISEKKQSNSKMMRTRLANAGIAIEGLTESEIIESYGRIMSAQWKEDETKSILHRMRIAQSHNARSREQKSDARIRAMRTTIKKELGIDADEFDVRTVKRIWLARDRITISSPIAAPPQS